MSETTKAGRFNLRLVGPDELRWDGLARDFVREPRDYERHLTVEIYDSRWIKGFSPLGQFVSAYGVEQIESLLVPSRLCLHGGVPEWTMTVEETEALVAFVQEGVN
jgi:hypothetical protein